MVSGQGHLSRKMAAILHADVAGSTGLVQLNESVAHERIKEAFSRFSLSIEQYGGTVHEIRGDALVAEFSRASDAVCAALVFQKSHARILEQLNDEITPTIRIGVSLGEVVFADGTVTGAGVVLAQRVEQLAESGGVCITGAIHEALPQYMPFDQENLGEQQVKGFDEAVRVYRVELRPGESIPLPQESSQLGASSKTRRLIIAVAAIALVVVGGAGYWFKPWEVREEPASVERMAFPLPDKPSIAVLPFTNLSADSEQEYFADGMTDDLITDLSKLSGLFVIARNSVFTYKGKPVKVRQVAEELGVRYVLEGSVRRADDKVRINAQLIDATTGGHVWAERYDSSLTDIFELQDKITKNIVAALSVSLTAVEGERQAHKGTDSLEAYDAFLRGWAHYRLYTPEDFAKSVLYFEKAIQLDPNYGRVHAALANVYWESRDNHWVQSLGMSYAEVREKTRRHLEEALKEPTPLAHRVAANRLVAGERWDEAIVEAERAIALDPNDPDGYAAMSRALITVGKAAESLEFIKKAMRLDPQSEQSWWLGYAQFHLERYDEAAATMLRATKRNPSDEWNFFLLATAYGQLGREQEAKSAIDAFNKMWLVANRGRPFTLADIDDWAFKDPVDRERLREGLRKAGIPKGKAARPVAPITPAEMRSIWLGEKRPLE